MDPRSHPSRPPSTSLPQGSAPISSMQMPQYPMQPQYPVSQPHTLPPLQPHHNQSPNPYMGQSYRPDMARYPATSAHDVYATAAPIGPHTPVSSLPPTSFLAHPGGQPQGQPPQGYQSPQTLLPPTTGSQSYPQPIAPAPPRDRRPDYAAMPSGAFSHPEGRAPIWAGADPMAAANGAAPLPDNREPPRTQVVGSQGRRGILPSVPGRAAVPNGANGTARSTTIPAKDADGKFPCPHCTKTYLHAKHLKRHLLRHTGDRPYMCVLCKDTFSRSDILKRHFQKCSLRRGNPTGASHLSHPQAHLKRSQAAAAKSVQEEVSNSIPPSNGIAGTTYGDAHVNGRGPRPGLTEQQPLGYPMSSVHGLNSGDAFNQADHRASWMAAQKQSPYLVHSSASAEGPGGHLNNIDRHSFEQAKPPIINDPKRPMMPGQPQQPNHPGELDWASMFQPGAPEGYMHSVFPQTMAPQHEPIHSHVDPDRKYYPTTTAGPHQDGGLNGLYLASTSLSGDGMPNPSGVPNNEKTNPQEPIAT
ncbi:C2H2 transcription factor RfeC [Talaromyces stipitatus ATCC 10500]|uniref:C2H2 transcription factor RfeC n=1 Tax=Talaromyces stipitatus (strain ATCC 10500 / CBS 375.48 / QM 6759 / NRRL 1006) TaxID=441959 RepID=B8M8T1_TALSN|nr:C2H2 transcription factor RfeC [Talaromyces stipitatus ATCC 10500]EED20593.1 C2H2 transcription factor RfeC [Talaromyces stipitatus ATCC 10500]